MSADKAFRGRHLGVLAILLAGGSACAAPEPDGVLRVFGEPTQTFEQSLEQAAVAAEWVFPIDGPIDPWSVHDLEELKGRNGRWWRVTASADPQFLLPVSLEAEAISGVEVSLAAPARGDAKLFWTTSNEGFSEAAQLTAPQAGRGNRTVRLEFPVERHEGWRGHITALRFDPAGGEGSRVQLELIRVRRRTSLEESAAASQAPTWIDLGGERRAGVLIDGQRTWRVATPTGAESLLTFAFGALSIPPGLATVVELDIVVRPAPDARPLARWTGMTIAQAGWHTVTLELGALRSSQLHIEAFGHSDDPERVLPALGTLELYGVDGSVDRSMSQRARTR